MEDPTYSDEQKAAILQRAYDLLEQAELERPAREVDMAEREARRLAGDEDPLERSERLRRQYQPEPPPRTPAKQRHNSMNERERHNLANYIRSAVERQVAAALRRERAELADVIGKTIVAERKTFRAINDALTARMETVERRAAAVERRGFFESLAERVSAIEQRAAPDNGVATVLDLASERDERRRRA